MKTWRLILRLLSCHAFVLLLAALGFLVAGATARAGEEGQGLKKTLAGAAGSQGKALAGAAGSQPEPQSLYLKRATWAETIAAYREGLARQSQGFTPWASGVLRGGQPARQLSVNVAGLDDLWLVVDRGGNRRGPDHAVWGEARLIDKEGRETPLSTLKPAFVRLSSQRLFLDQNHRKEPLRIAGRRLAHGLWMMPGEVCFRLDRKYERFEALVGLDASAEKRGSVQFRVLSHPHADPWASLERDFPVESDWMLQDLAGCGFACSHDSKASNQYPGRWFTPKADDSVERKLILRVVEELGADGQRIRAEAQRLEQAQTPPHTRPWLELYAEACQRRRALRLRPVIDKSPRFIFTKHYNMGGSHYAYTEGQSDAQAERHFIPGSALCLFEMAPSSSTTHHSPLTMPVVHTLIHDPHGVIRDPDVSYEGQRVLFAWKKSDRLDDYHLHELDLASGKVRQLTFGLGFADYEGAYLANGDIIFNSTRCVQTVDCFTTEVSNLYTCDRDGRYLRRLGFDQVHSNFPTVTEDGRVLYTRWEYNDRGQIFPQGLFQMNSDGTGQTVFYGNNSYFPTTILHARQIPGTQKVLGMATGHHSRQTGKLIILDPARGRQENSGAQLVAPVRDTPAVRVDAYGQDGDLWQYPYPLSETEYLVTYNPWGWSRDPLLFGIYFMTVDGRRELLVSDPEVSCNQPVPLRRPAPLDRPNTVDYTRTTGTYYVQDVYAGPGLADVPRGKARKLRVVGLDFRAALMGGNNNHGEAGGAFVATPVAISQGCWDPKILLGEAPIYEDGSVFFTAPARTPMYFQVVDDKGYVIQTMRSWSTLQPGENASCVGCHEHKNSSPVLTVLKEALRHGPKPLEPFYGPARGFSFPKEVQPIMDRHCIRCHDDRSPGAGAPPKTPHPKHKTPNTGNEKERSFSLLAEENIDPAAKRRFSDAYLALTGAVQLPNKAWEGVSRPLVNWISPQSGPPMRAPYSAGAATSGLMKLLEEGHKGVKLNREDLDKLACWIDLVVPFCGDYLEANAWTPPEKERYEYFLAKRKKWEAMEARNILQLLAAKNGSQVQPGAPEARELTLAVVGGDGAVVVRKTGRAALGAPLTVEMPRRFQPGDRVQVEGAKHLALQVDPQLGEALLFAPEGKLDWPVPVSTAQGKSQAAAYPAGAFQAARPRLIVRPAVQRELDVYRNLAVNPHDVRGAAAAYPHASASSECRGEAVFAARNAIDGCKKNLGHGGWPFQSWGPDKEKNLWWQVEFGRPVEVDQVVLVLRADFPHDRHWHHATLLFSDGYRQTLALEKTAEPQRFRFGARKTTSLKLLDLSQDDPPGWCALSELEAWGRDPLPVAEDQTQVGR